MNEAEDRRTLPRLEGDKVLIDVDKIDINKLNQAEIARVNKNDDFGCRRSSMEFRSSCSLASSDGAIARRLTLARRKGQARLRCLRGPTLFLGPFCACIGGLTFLVAKSNPALLSLAVFWLVIGLLILTMSLLPGDVRAVPLSVALVAIPAALVGTLHYAWFSAQYMKAFMSKHCQFLVFEDGSEIPCHLLALLSGLSAQDMLTDLAVGCYFLKCLTNKLDAKNLLSKIWQVIHVAFFFFSLSALSRSLIRFGAGRVTAGISYLANTVVMVVACAVAGRYDYVVQIQSWLMSQGEAAIAAAGIAELLGGKRTKDILAYARESFLCIEAGKLMYDDVRDNKPNATLAALTQRASLGHVDAFVSHSWHDDPVSKWASLRAWCEEFRRDHPGSEPTLWIDKYCIDQNNIEDSLSSLPVYLSGCRKLLILCGTTFLSRLWCLIEIFVFMEMGRDLQDLEIRFLEREGSGEPSSQTEASSASLSFLLSTFNVYNARCSTMEDTVRLQRVIEVTGAAKINKLVRDVFVSKFSENRKYSLDWKV